MNRFKNILREVKASSPILYGIVMLHLLMAIGCIIGLIVDDRTLVGVNIWIKPLKFCLSGGIYIFTVGYLNTLYPYSTRRKNIINNIVSWTLAIEIGIIVMQAARGVQSHYNQSSLLDGLLFAAMGILIAINVLIMFMYVIDTLRLKMKVDRPVQWAILMGWIVVIAGSWVGGQMIGQLSHNVGVPDGGAGLPLVNWSTVGGDLRVAHFFGLHGIQIIPLFAVWVASKKKLRLNKQFLAVLVFGVLYASWIGFTFYQASQAIPLLKL